MPIRDLGRWRNMVSLGCTFIVWTMFGAFALSRGQYEDKLGKEDAVEEQDDPYKLIHKTAHTKTVIIYKKDFVPYTSRIYNLYQYISGGSGPGDGNK